MSGSTGAVSSPDGLLHAQKDAAEGLQVVIAAGIGESQDEEVRARLGDSADKHNDVGAVVGLDKMDLGDDLPPIIQPGVEDVGRRLGFLQCLFTISPPMRYTAAASLASARI